MYKHLPVAVIVAAVHGDAEAMHIVLSHYRSYILALSKRFGYVDVEAICHMESKLLYAITKFRLN